MFIFFLYFYRTSRYDLLYIVQLNMWKKIFVNCYGFNKKRSYAISALICNKNHRNMLFYVTFFVQTQVNMTLFISLFLLLYLNSVTLQSRFLVKQFTHHLTQFLDHSICPKRFNFICLVSSFLQFLINLLLLFSLNYCWLNIL